MPTADKSARCQEPGFIGLPDASDANAKHRMLERH